MQQSFTKIESMIGSSTNQQSSEEHLLSRQKYSPPSSATNNFTALNLTSPHQFSFNGRLANSNNNRQLLTNGGSSSTIGFPPTNFDQRSFFANFQQPFSHGLMNLHHVGLNESESEARGERSINVGEQHGSSANNIDSPQPNSSGKNSYTILTEEI